AGTATGHGAPRRPPYHWARSRPLLHRCRTVMTRPTTPVRGMRDLLPADTAIRDQLTGIILETYMSWGFRRVETPALEHIEVLTGAHGGENETLIFKIMKRGAKLDIGLGTDVDRLIDSGLRFDLTVPLARLVANNRHRLTFPLKVIQVGPVWRAERPQRGRFRQLTQCDIDILGVPGVESEI